MTQGDSKSKPLAILMASICILMTVLAFGFQYVNTSSVTVPVEEDIYRDLGAANSMMKGYTSSDSHLLGEKRWYNPLIPWLVSVIGRTTHISTFDIYTHAGVLLNLLGPIALILLVARVFSLYAACFALAAYLFFGQHEFLSSRYPTYSAWPWPYNFSQGLALITLAVMSVACERNRPIQYLIAGIFLGVTFLSHTAPACILALTMVLVCLAHGLKGVWSWPTSILNLFLVGAPSFLIAMILLAPLFSSYHFHTLNTAPGSFTSLYLSEIFILMLNWKNVVAAPAMAFLVIYSVHPGSTRASWTPFSAFFIASAVFLVYGVGAELLRGKDIADLPQIVPTFHFHLYFVLSLYVAFGIGCEWLIAHIIKAELPRAVSTIAILVLLIGMSWPDYSRNLDTVKFVENAAQLAEQHELLDIYQWCLNETQIDDVFLTDDYLGLYAVGAAARKLIVLDPLFTSPFVDFNQRADDRSKLYFAIQGGDQETFRKIADRYHIKYIMTGPKFKFGLYLKGTLDTTSVQIEGLKLVKNFGDIRVYRRI